MSKTCIRVISVALNEFTEFMNGEHSVFNGIALVQETLTDLGYHVTNRHLTTGDEATLYPVKLFIKTALEGQTNGIPTNVNVMVRPANPGCYAVMFFK
ncbi:hypothetical protein [Vibrio phage 2 TSL-2019]|uniref:Uncharacterized protein n=1 Tax=Vibrio phage 2 TSL-2019 TaxID=2508172 RepID=A0A513PW53_9CAUD|nr:hypothetical protein HWC03_gp006 [Vibrio phage 2 TSL-2019]QAU04161.1 hypothetical protein [Vibrio phage 2 TSL-2019]